MSGFEKFALHSHSPFANLPLMSGPGHAVVAGAREELAIVRIAARKGQAETLAQRIRKHFNIELPRGARRVEMNGLAFAGVGVDTWLAMLDAGDAGVRNSFARAGRRTAAANAATPSAMDSLNAFAASLRDVVDDAATVSDQIGGYAILRLTGPRVTDALAKFVPIDLHPRVFTIGSAASTIASHIPLTLWRLVDATEGAPTFELAVPRSYAASFWHAVAESAAEFGMVRAGAPADTA